ncbi:MAG: hypothetical protein RL071_265 [Pseudomonadota bacterium]
MKGAPRLGALLGHELRLLSRDPTALASMLLLPFIIVLVGLLVVLGSGEGVKARLAAEIALVDAPEDFWAEVEPADRLSPAPTPAEAVVSVVADPVDPGAAPTDRPVLTVVFSSKDLTAQRARRRVEDVLERVRVEDEAARWQAAGIPLRPDELMKLTEVDLDEATDRAGALLSRLVAPLLVAVLLSGALPVGIATLPAERENGTFESLLVSSLDRRTLLWGKALVVLGACGAVGLVGLSALVVAVALSPLQLGPLSIPDLAVPPARLALVALLALPLLLQLSAGILALCARARDARQARVLAAPLLLVAGGLASLPAVPGATEISALTLIPVGGPALAIASALQGGLGTGAAAGALLGGLAWAALALTLTERLLQNTALLPQAAEDRSAGRTGREALATAGVAFVAFWFLGQLLQARDLVSGLLLSQALTIALPGLLGVVAAGRPLREALRLRAPRGRDLALGLVAGALCPLVGQLVADLQAPLLPTPTRALEEMGALLTLDLPLPLVIALLALLPAICEELLFRGALLGLLERSLPPAGRVALVAALFGLLHLSYFRILPTAALGLLFGAAALRSGSLLVPVLMHLLNNGLLVGAVGLGLIGAEDEAPLWAGVAAVVAATTAVAAMRGGAGTDGAPAA